MFKNKLKILAVIPILSILLLIGFAKPTKAAQFINKDYTLTQTEIVEENLYINGETVEISGVVDGDLFITANTLILSGTITGDLYAIAMNADISGNIYGSTFLLAQNSKVSGSIARNLYTASMYSDISGSIGKDAMIFATNSTITGKVSEDVRVFSTFSSITGTVKGEAIIYSSSSTKNEDAITGEIYENIDNTQDKEEITVPKQQKNIISEGFNNALLGINFSSTVIGFVAMYIVGIVIIYLAPVKTLQIEKKITGSMQEFLFSFLIGLAISIVVPLPLIILTFTLIGAPLAILITAILLFAMIFGTIWVESAIGQKILASTEKKDPKRLLSLLIGRGLTTVINFIPIVRGIYKWTLSMTALGAVARMKYDAYSVTKETKKVTKK